MICGAELVAGRNVNSARSAIATSHYEALEDAASAIIYETGAVVRSRASERATDHKFPHAMNSVYFAECCAAPELLVHLARINFNVADKSFLCSLRRIKEKSRRRSDDEKSCDTNTSTRCARSSRRSPSESRVETNPGGLGPPSHPSSATKRAPTQPQVQPAARSPSERLERKI
jgi:hypothetical protein